MKKINEIILINLELKTFTKQDAEDYCLLNNLNNDDIIELYLWNNELTDITGIKLFKNLEALRLDYNQLINNISVIKYLKKLKYLGIINLELKSDQIKYINSLKNLKELYCEKGFKDMSVLNQLNNNIKVIK